MIEKIREELGLKGEGGWVRKGCWETGVGDITERVKRVTEKIREELEPKEEGE